MQDRVPPSTRQQIQRRPVVPVHRPGELPFSEIRPTRDPEDSPWLDTFINLGAEQSGCRGRASAPAKKPAARAMHLSRKKKAA